MIYVRSCAESKDRCDFETIIINLCITIRQINTCSTLTFLVRESRDLGQTGNWEIYFIHFSWLRDMSYGTQRFDISSYGNLRALRIVPPTSQRLIARAKDFWMGVTDTPRQIGLVAMTVCGTKSDLITNTSSTLKEHIAFWDMDGLSTPH